MAQNLTVNIGEEYLVDESPNGSTHTVGLYNDATDQFSETSDIGDETTEPTNTNYARQSTTVTTQQLSGNYGYNNDSLLSFDFSDQSTSEVVDTALDITNFESSVAGDASGSPADHLIGNPALSQDRDIGSIDTLEIAAGDLTVTVD